MHTSIEHLASCPTCLRKTLQRRVVVLDEHGEVVSDESVCIACANRGTRVTTPVLRLDKPRPVTGAEPAPRRETGGWRRRGGAA